MIKKLVIGIFLVAILMSLFLVFQRKNFYFDPNEDNSGPRFVLEDFDFIEYKGETVVKSLASKMGVIRENLDTEFFSVVRYSDLEESGKFSPCDVSSNHAEVRFVPGQDNQGQYMRGVGNKIQYAVIDSSVRMRSKGDRFLKSEKIVYEGDKLSSDTNSSLVDNNTSIYSKTGFLYDMKTDILQIDSFVTGDIKGWKY